MQPYTKLILPEIQEFLEKGEVGHVRAALEELHPADISDIAQNLYPAQTAELIAGLELKTGIAVFEHLQQEKQLEVIETMGRKRLVEILDGMSGDDRADLVRALPGATVEALLPLLAQAERNDVRRLMAYPEETAGAVMTTEYASLPADLTVEQALADLRKVAPDRETIYYVYVTDADRRLRGVLSLRDILTAAPRKTLKDIMTEKPIAVRVDEDREQVARVFAKYDLTAAPVVDADGRLVGLITVDDVIDILEAEQTEDVHRLGAVQPLETSYLTARPWELIRKRAIWLVLLSFAGLLTSAVLEGFHGSVPAVELIFFVPLIIASAGNSGSQSAMLVTRALAVGDVRPGDLLRVLLRESGVAVALGAILAVIGIGRVLGGGMASGVAVVVGASLIAVVLFGSLLGALLPLVLWRVGIDPAVASSPFVASVADVVGCLIYFGIAGLVLA